MKKIVIIGSSGFLGLNLTLKLSNNYKIFPIINKKKINIKNIKFIYLNIKKDKLIFKFLNKIKPDYLINCVAFSDVEKCETKKKYTLETNTNLAHRFAKICNKLNIHYIFVSSDHIFSGRKIFYKEIDDTNPINIYAKSKVLAEEKIKKYCKKYLILRTNFYGFGPKFRTSSLVDKIIKNFKNNSEVNLLNDVNFTPIHIDQLVNILLNLLENAKIGVFNIASNQRLTKYQFGLKIAKKFGFKTNLLRKLYLKDIKKNVLRPKEMSLSNNKIKKIINKNSLFDLTVGISQLYKTYKSSYYKKIKKIK